MKTALPQLCWELSAGGDDRGRLVPPKRLAMYDRVDPHPQYDSSPPVAAGGISIADYLASEELSSIKREYVGGFVYAMAGASDAHNAITTNLVALLRPVVRSAGGRIYSSGMKVRIDELLGLPEDKDAIFYYPDVMVVCAKG